MGIITNPSSSFLLFSKIGQLLESNSNRHKWQGLCWPIYHYLDSSIQCSRALSRLINLRYQDVHGGVYVVNQQIFPLCCSFQDSFCPKVDPHAASLHLKTPSEPHFPNMQTVVFLSAKSLGNGLHWKGEPRGVSLHAKTPFRMTAASWGRPPWWSRIACTCPTNCVACTSSSWWTWSTEARWRWNRSCPPCELLATSTSWGSGGTCRQILGPRETKWQRHTGSHVFVCVGVGGGRQGG